MNSKGSSDPVAEFIARVDRLEERFKGDKYSQDYWMMPVGLLKKLRDELKKDKVDDLPLFRNPNGEAKIS